MTSSTRGEVAAADGLCAVKEGSKLERGKNSRMLWENKERERGGGARKEGEKEARERERKEKENIRDRDTERDRE